MVIRISFFIVISTPSGQNIVDFVSISLFVTLTFVWSCVVQLQFKLLFIITSVMFTIEKNSNKQFSFELFILTKHQYIRTWYNMIFRHYIVFFKSIFCVKKCYISDCKTKHFWMNKVKKKLPQQFERIYFIHTLRVQTEIILFENML